MKLQFLADGAQDCPLIRLYEFQTTDAARLKALFDSLADGSRTEVSLVEEIDVESIDGCQLDLRVGARDVGVVQIGSLSFECVLTATRWFDVASLTEPFCKAAEANTFQWLNEDGPISLLLSASGAW
jgi:hypothetical protein